MTTLKKGENTYNHIIKATRAILVVNGFHNTSINDITKATGVKKGNLYYHFASKEDLGLSVLEDAKNEFFKFLEDSFQGDSSYDKVVNSCRAIFDEMENNNFVGGCLFGNAALEMSDSNPRFSSVIHEVFSHWIEEIDRHLSNSETDNSPNISIPSRLLAKSIVATVEGAIMMSRVSKDRKDLRDCLAVIKAMLGK